MIEGVYLVGGLWVFALGTVVGSFVNVCVYRLPWQKSVIWPGSHCPKCQSPILARDNVPVLGWLVLRGACRRCGLSISARYPLVELLTGGIFAATFATDVVASPVGILDTLDFVRLGYHLILVTMLLVALLIDAELLIIPDEVTVTGMVLGLGIGALVPGVRPAPAEASTMFGGLITGLIGWAVGGGLVWAFRFVAGAIFRREAMGFGDVTLLAMIGAFMGWQAAVLTFFLAPFFGLGVAVWKLGKLLRKKLAGLKTTASEHEMPFGPYLSMAALMLLLLWPWIWEGWAKGLFAQLAELVRIVRFLLRL